MPIWAIDDDSLESTCRGNDHRVRTGACVVFPNTCGADGKILGRHYFDVLDDSSFLFWDVCGLGRKSLENRGLATVIGQYDMHIHERARAGSALSVESGITRIGAKSVLLEHDIVEIETNTRCASATGTHVFFDLARRRSSFIPDDVRDFLCSRSDQRSAPVAPGTDRETRSNDGFQWEVVDEGIVESGQCDHLGHLNARYHARLFVDAARSMGIDIDSIDEGPGRRGSGDTIGGRIRVDYEREAVRGTRYHVLCARADSDAPNSSVQLRLVDRDRAVALSRCQLNLPLQVDVTESFSGVRSNAQTEGVER